MLNKVDNTVDWECILFLKITKNSVKSERWLHCMEYLEKTNKKVGLTELSETELKSKVKRILNF